MSEEQTTQEAVVAPELPKLTVAQFIADMSKFPQDSELVGALFGVGMTIPIFQAISVEVDGKQLTILQMSKEGAIRALRHDMDMQQQTLTAEAGENGGN